MSYKHIPTPGRALSNPSDRDDPGETGTPVTDEWLDDEIQWLNKSASGYNDDGCLCGHADALRELQLRRAQERAERPEQEPQGALGPVVGHEDFGLDAVGGAAALAHQGAPLPNPDNGHGAADGFGGHGEYCDCGDCIARDNFNGP